MIPALRILAAAVLALAFAGLASAQQRETRAASGFTGIALSVAARLTLVQGATEGVVLEGPRDALDNIETVVEKATLHIRPRKRSGFVWPPGRIRATVNARNIESIAVSGSGDITADTLRSGALRVSIAGSGDLKIAALQADSAEVAISGSCDVKLAGRVPEVSARISGSGDLHAERLESRRVSVSIAGSGDVGVWARESLAVRVAGSGGVRYYGEPTIEKTILGSGSVKRLGAAPS